MCLNWLFDDVLFPVFAIKMVKLEKYRVMVAGILFDLFLDLISDVS